MVTFLPKNIKIRSRV